jgi:putative transposase
LRDVTIIQLWSERKALGVPLSCIYAFLGMSRQAIWQKIEAERVWQAIEKNVLSEVNALREAHPRMGARKIYEKWSACPENEHLVFGIGRDKFEQILMSNGLKISKLCAGHRTTYSGVCRFPNLIAGQVYTNINQVWMSDITYYWIEGEWVYITLILDVYSRFCLAAVLSRTLKTEDTTLPALKMALKSRGHLKYANLIFHSDGGGQYYDKNFVKLLRENNIKSSMGLSCYENPFSERLNSTVKNEYLLPKKPITFSALAKELLQTQSLYNTDRPHQSLNYLTPVAYETFIAKIEENQRMPLKIVVVESK